MKSALRNVTLTLEEEVARWARLEAARQDTSVSRLLSSILKQRMMETDNYEKSMRRALSGKPLFKSDGKHMTREEIHERPRLR
jgi:tRNA uridine 5-carbamoylmethylation protein Kti12